MSGSVPEKTISEFTTGVCRIVECRIRKSLARLYLAGGVQQLVPGKMLRTRLAARLNATESLDVPPAILQSACAAVELVHTASLCHDDVVDNALIRRMHPTLWRRSGSSGAVLVGDLLLCEAIDLLLGVEGGRLLGKFMEKIREVVGAEAEQELLLRGKTVDEETCLRMAREKTGPLFAFVASVCGGGDDRLSEVLEEAGYRMGTAYQLSDDLIDVIGSERTSGKTLGGDFLRRKFTLPQVPESGTRITTRHIGRLFSSAFDGLEEYPRVRQGLNEFLVCDMQPVLERQMDVDMELAV